MSKEIKSGEIKWTRGKPIQFEDLTDSQVSLPKLTKGRKEPGQRVANTVKKYLLATKDLSSGKYANVANHLPDYLRHPGHVIVASTRDGVVVRYQRGEELKVIAAWMDEPLAEAMTKLSEGLIHCYTERPYESKIPETGLELKFTVHKADGSLDREIASAKIGFDAVLEKPDSLPQPPSKPYCLLSVRNSFDVQVHGVEFRTEGHSPERPFIATTTIGLGVGWDCIEVYPFIRLKDWKPEYAKVWAENDVLGAVVAAQSREAHMSELDPRAAARAQLGSILAEYQELLESDPDREETLQRFLKANPRLLCAAHVAVWPKLDLGNRQTDFVFRDATGNYLLVELEKSTVSLFRKDGHTANGLNVARGQVQDWLRYIEDNLHTTQNELGLTGISVNPNCLIVIGRSRGLTKQDRRKLRTIENESPNLSRCSRVYNSMAE